MFQRIVKSRGSQHIDGLCTRIRDEYNATAHLSVEPSFILLCVLQSHTFEVKFATRSNVARPYGDLPMLRTRGNKCLQGAGRALLCPSLDDLDLLLVVNV